MLHYFSDHFANPSSVYDLGSSIKEVIKEQREAEALTQAIENYQDRRAGNLDASGSKLETVKKRNTCTRCDGDNPDDAKFCMACGERIEC